MKLATGTTLVTNGRLIDGTGRPPIDDAVLIIENGHIAYAGSAAQAPALTPDASRIDARGGTIMPGLVEAHFHPTYFNVAALEDLDIKYPVEYVTLLAAANAQLALECGYTAARSGGSLFNIDVWLKKAIENDLVPGPRLAASGREICGVGGLMDWNPDFRKIGMEGLVLLVNGPDEARAAVRKLVKDGVEWVKTYPTGDAAAPDTNDHHTLCMTFEEMHAVVADGPQPQAEGDRPLPRDRGHQERPAGRLRHARARHLHGRRGARPAAGAQRAGASRRCSSSRPASSTGRSSACRSAVIDGHKETLEGGAESARTHPEGRRPARHGRRLRLRLEPARRLRQGADLLRQVRRLHAAGDDHAAPRRPAPRSWAAATSSARWRRASWPTCWSSTATCWPTSSLLEDRARFIAVMQGGIVKAGQLSQRAQ